MKIEFTGRQMNVTPDLQAFAEEHMKKLRRILRSAPEVHAILTAEKHRRKAEFTLKFRDHTLIGIEETHDARASIKGAIEKIERQAVRLFERRRSRKRRPRPSTAVLFNVLSPASHDHEDRQPLEVERVPLKPLSVGEAIECLDEASRGVVVFRNAETERVNVVFRAPDGRLTLIEPVS